MSDHWTRVSISATQMISRAEIEQAVIGDGQMLTTHLLDLLADIEVSAAARQIALDTDYRVELRVSRRAKEDA